ncbi:hypothetical protein [Streptomyces sp. NPDC051636]|uniref:hypothetical protein n=1 Tax=Streptomyces sp. NPDC051636 TaxID=3365663 RepID=UPI00379CA33E
MKPIVFGAIVGLLVAYPVLLAIVLSVTVALVSQPAVLALAASVLLWPRVARRVRRWTA